MLQWPSDDPVLIGTGSWLGTGVVVLPGSRLGRNVVVGAGAVVRGTFPDHCVIAGVPARIVRRYVPGSGWIEGPPEPGSAPTASPFPGRLRVRVGIGREHGPDRRGGGFDRPRGDVRFRDRHGPRPRSSGVDRTGPAEPVAPDHLGGLFPALGDEGLGGGEIVEVPGRPVAPGADDDLHPRGQLGHVPGETGVDGDHQCVEHGLHRPPGRRRRVDGRGAQQHDDPGGAGVDGPADRAHC